MNLLPEFSRFPDGWKVLPFLDVFKDVTSKGIKVKKENYDAEGELPVVDQGKKLFGGYTDIANKVKNIELPVIIFGDHTKVFKLIESDFAVGADGVKLLEPIVEADKKFLFFYLNQLTLEDAGYSRHYKFLKETYIPLPPLEIQKQIAAVLEKADQLRKDCQQMEQELNSLAQSVFIDMFGDPVTNPMGWKVTTLQSIAKVQIGPFGTQLHKHDYVSNGVPLINPTHIRSGLIVPDFELTVSADKFETLKQYHLKIGDIIMGRRGEMGRTAVIDDISDGWFCGTGSLFVRLDSEKITASYLNYVLSCPSMKIWLEEQSLGATMANLNKKILHSISVSLPPIELQKKYENALSLISEQKQIRIVQLNEVSLVFEAIMQKAFKGELELTTNTAT